MKMEPYNFHDYHLQQIKKEPKQEFQYQPPIKKELKQEFKIEKYNIKQEPQDVKTEHGKPERKLDMKSSKHEKEPKKKKKKKQEESKRDKVEPTSRESANKKKKSKAKEDEKRDPLNWNYVKCPQCWIWVKQHNMRYHMTRHMNESPELGSMFARPQRINIEEKRAQSELAAARAREALELSRSANASLSSVPAALEEEEDYLKEDDSVVGDMFSWSPPPITSSPPSSPSAHTSPLSPPVSPSPSWSPLSPQLSPS